MALFENKDKIIADLNGQINILKFRIQDLEREKSSLLNQLEHLKSDSLVQSLQAKIEEQAEYINTYVSTALTDPKQSKRHKIKQEILQQAEEAQIRAEVKQELSGGDEHEH